MMTHKGVQRGYPAEFGREFPENDAARPVVVIVGSARPDRAGFGRVGLFRFPRSWLFERLGRQNLEHAART